MTNEEIILKSVQAHLTPAQRHEIAAVNSYIPYSRGMQNAEYPTINALRIRACRARKADVNHENHNSR